MERGILNCLFCKKVFNTILGKPGAHLYQKELRSKEAAV